MDYVIKERRQGDCAFSVLDISNPSQNPRELDRTLEMSTEP